MFFLGVLLLIVALALLVYGFLQFFDIVAAMVRGNPLTEANFVAYAVTVGAATAIGVGVLVQALGLMY